MYERYERFVVHKVVNCLSVQCRLIEFHLIVF